jgi:hypothetical protein
MPSADAELLRALKGALDGLGLRWYLFGAQAAILYGAARFTEDFDVTVELGELPTRNLIDAMVGAGFTPRFADAAFIERTRVVPFVHDSTTIPVDIVLAGPGLEATFLDGAIQTEVDGVSVPVARAEDLVVMKILAGRSKDLEDVAAVLAANPTEFDKAHARRLLSLLEEALSQSDLLPLFEDALRRARR